jgi:hypothetical protein
VILAVLGVLPATMLTPYAAFAALGAAQGLFGGFSPEAVFLLALGLGGLFGSLGLWSALVRGPSFHGTLFISAGISSVLGLYSWAIYSFLSDPSGPPLSISANLLDFLLFGCPAVVGALEIRRFFRHQLRHAA